MKTRQLRISFSSIPAAARRIYQSLGKRLTAVENPVWAGLIATFVRAKGFSVEIVDAEADELTPEQAADRVTALSPRPGRRRRLRPSAVGVDAEHDRRLRARDRHQERRRQTSRC